MFMQSFFPVKQNQIKKWIETVLFWEILLRVIMVKFKDIFKIWEKQFYPRFLSGMSKRFVALHFNHLRLVPTSLSNTPKQVKFTSQVPFY